MVGNTQSKPLSRTHGFSHHGRKNQVQCICLKNASLTFFFFVTENFATFRLISSFSRNDSVENAAEFCGAIESIVSLVGSDEA